MTDDNNAFSAIRRNSTVLIVVGVCLFLIEMEILAVAAMKSGRQSRLHILNNAGEVVYETDGNNLSSFDKYYFEKTFGPLDQYQVKLISREIPFPFRAWFAAAVGIPVGLVLLFVFIVKVYAALFHGEKDGSAPFRKPESDASRLEKMLFHLGRLNIYTIGFLIFLAIFSYWTFPNLLIYLGRLGEETIVKYKWLLLGASLVVLGLVVWVIYLRYLLAKKVIESRTEMDLCRLRLEYQHRRTMQIGLDGRGDDACQPAEWKECKAEESSQAPDDSFPGVKQ
ncbi:MAG: hypothetical protein ACOZF0_09785 [Thermodesulfobacteriota bacterium]